MNKGLLLLAVAGAAAASPAQATVTICLGGGCSTQPDAQVQFDKDETGTTITAGLNKGSGTVTFTSLPLNNDSGQELLGSANGQARVSAVTGVLDHPLSVTYDQGLISAIEFILDSETGGKVFFTFAGGDSDGQTTQSYDIDTSGNQFFNGFDGTFKTLTINLSDGLTLSDAGQFRINAVPGGSLPGPVPEPTTWAMLIAGFAFVGAAMRRRRETRIRYDFA
jgi:hypothetical protein